VEGGDTPVTPVRYEVIGVTGLAEIRAGEDMGRLIAEAAAAQGTPLATHDVLVVGQKVISKAEGRILRLSEVEPAPATRRMAESLGRDPRLVEVILRESRRVVRMDKGVIITETHHGWICANAGVDQSNVDLDTVALLPEDPDRSARALRDRIHALTGAEVAVVVSDTFGRPWREGLTNVAIGLAGMAALRDYVGVPDSAGRPLQATILAVADELAGAAEIVMGKLDRIPAAIVRGLRVEAGEGGSKPLLREPARDLFR
jgi:coenzyme F420-0:L-glutamate ligase/coenzyme F420-1:gamma-L-glutamate ligase